ncbi:hypothetical protein [Candidatus Nitrosocaldus islandicus]|nr:hypothetical protein [Candidatus Nitrosocaldus islandicus]
MKVELDSRYGECCKDSRNWELTECFEIACNKCGRILTSEEIVVAVAFA